MIYRTFSEEGWKISAVGLGTWQFGGEWGQNFSLKEVEAVVDACRETGVNFVDTAECYGDGVSEKLVGEALSRDRENWILATKFGHRYLGLGKREQLWSAEDVKKQLEQSLRNLRTDYIDLYQFHSGDDRFFDNPALWDMLARELEVGTIRMIGVSLTSRADIRDSQAPKVKETGARAAQVVYNRLDRGAEDVVLPTCERENLGVLARVPLASGFLTGKYKADVEFAPADYRSGLDRERILTTVAQVEELRRSEVPEGVPMAAWAISWCLNNPAVACVIPGARNPEQLKANAAAADLAEPGHRLNLPL